MKLKSIYIDQGGKIKGNQMELPEKPEHWPSAETNFYEHLNYTKALQSFKDGCIEFEDRDEMITWLASEQWDAFEESGDGFTLKRDAILPVDIECEVVEIAEHPEVEHTSYPPFKKVIRLK